MSCCRCRPLLVVVLLVTCRGAGGFWPQTDDFGVARFPLSLFPSTSAESTVSVVVTDGSFAATSTRVLDLRRVTAGVGHGPYRSLSLAQSLDTARHIVQRRRITALQVGEGVAVTITSDTKAEDYDNVGKVYSLLCTVSGNSTLANDFSFLPKWSSLGDEGAWR